MELMLSPESDASSDLLLLKLDMEFFLWIDIELVLDGGGGALRLATKLAPFSISEPSEGALEADPAGVRSEGFVDFSSFNA